MKNGRVGERICFDCCLTPSFDKTSVYNALNKTMSGVRSTLYNTKYKKGTDSEIRTLMNETEMKRRSGTTSPRDLDPSRGESKHKQALPVRRRIYSPTNTSTAVTAVVSRNRPE